MSTLEAVLNRIDQDLDKSVERLFALLRIASISTDAAYKKDCQKAAEHVASDLRSIGFEADVRPTAGHPVVVGKANEQSTGKGPRVLFYGHYDVQPVDPLDLWKTPPFEPRIEELPGGRKIIVARGACDDKGQAMTFIEASGPGEADNRSARQNVPRAGWMSILPSSAPHSQLKLRRQQADR